MADNGIVFIWSSDDIYTPRPAPGPYYQGQQAPYPEAGYQQPPGYGLPPPPPPPPYPHAPPHAPLNAGSIPDPFLQHQVYQPGPSNPAQAAPLPLLPPTPQPANADNNPPAPLKRRRGRPAGSKNKDKNAEKPPPKARGRPKGSLDSKPRSGYNFKDPRKEAARRSRKTAGPPPRDASPHPSLDDAPGSPYDEELALDLAPGPSARTSPPTDDAATSSGIDQDSTAPTSVDHGVAPAAPGPVWEEFVQEHSGADAPTQEESAPAEVPEFDVFGIAEVDGNEMLSQLF